MATNKRKQRSWWHVSRKEEVLCTLELKGRIPSKKNSVDFAYRKGRPIYLGNPGYRKAKKGFMHQLEEQLAGAPPIPGALNLHLKFYGNRETWWKEWCRGAHVKKYTGTDVDNKLASILDLLKDAGVFFDDTQVVEATAEKAFGKCPHLADYGALIVITRHSPITWPGGRFFRKYSEQ